MSILKGLIKKAVKELGCEVAKLAGQKITSVATDFQATMSSVKQDHNPASGVNTVGPVTGATTNHVPRESHR